MSQEHVIIEVTPQGVRMIELESTVMVQKCKEVYLELMDTGFIDAHLVSNWSDANKANLHSILQGGLIHGALKCGSFAVPEYKVHLKEPLSKQKVDTRFSGRRVRLQHVLRTDVAFFRRASFAGIGEVYTLDSLHGCVPSSQLQQSWLTHYDRLPHLIEHAHVKPSFVIVVSVIPRGIKPSQLPWADTRKRRVDEWEALWKKLIDDRIRKLVTDTRFLIVREKEIEVY